jgi:NADH-quinone oxidoreductase subunit F
MNGGAMEPILLRAKGNKDALALAGARRIGAYNSLEKALTREPAEIIQEVKRSNLRGRGGAGFPTGLKWQFSRDIDTEEKYVICNADESEPGTFKDREILRTDPHLLLEGIAIAAYAVGAHDAAIYIRGEFWGEADTLESAIAEAYQERIFGNSLMGSEYRLDLFVHRGAGAYICGEETALLNSMEGRRGNPRVRPPFPAASGFLQAPTVVNNVETLSCVPSIIEHGAPWFAKIGRPRNAGPKLYSVSGHVARPGVYELPLGTTFSEIIFEHAGGMRNGRSLKAFSPGGAATPIMPRDLVETPADFDSVAAAGSMLGSGGLIVMDDSACMVAVAKNSLEFMAHESCGKCSPCRIGTQALLDTLTQICEGGASMAALATLEGLAAHIQKISLCGLGQSAPAILLSTMQHFRAEYEDHISHGSCDVCRNE